MHRYIYRGTPGYSAGWKLALLAVLMIQLNLFPAWTEPLSTDKEQTLFEQGKALYLEKKFVEAQQCFDQCLRKEPDNAEYLSWMAQSLAQQMGEQSLKGASSLSLMDEGKRLWSLFEKAYKKDPQSERARLGYAVLLRDTPTFLGGDVDKAETLLLSVVKDNPSNLFALHHLGTLYARKRKDFPQGLHYLKEVIAQAQKRPIQKEEEIMQIPSTYNALGKIYLHDLQQQEEGLKYLQKAVELSPDNAPDRLALVEGYIEANRTEEAKEALCQAIQIIRDKGYKSILKEAKALAKKLKSSKELGL